MSGPIILTQHEFEQLIEQCPASYGPIDRCYLSRSLEVVCDMLDHHPRVCAMRIDLRFANESLESDIDSLVCMQRSDPAVITRFFESLKSQLREEHYRKGYRGDPALPAYIWCRERDTGPYPHYHLVLLFNKDRYAYLGNYTDPDAVNMATRIQRAWCSALQLPYPDNAPLVHFPPNHTYRFDRVSAALRDTDYTSFLIRLAYLSKLATKDIGDGRRNFGCSQCIG